MFCFILRLTRSKTSSPFQILALLLFHTRSMSCQIYVTLNFSADKCNLTSHSLPDPHIVPYQIDVMLYPSPYQIHALLHSTLYLIFALLHPSTPYQIHALLYHTPYQIITLLHPSSLNQIHIMLHSPYLPDPCNVSCNNSLLWTSSIFLSWGPLHCCASWTSRSCFGIAACQLYFSVQHSAQPQVGKPGQDWVKESSLG